MSIATLQRETLEYLPVVVTVNGTPTTVNVEFSIAAFDLRPTMWTSAVVIDDGIGVMVDGSELGTGDFKVFARVTDTPEIPVVECGAFRII